MLDRALIAAIALAQTLLAATLVLDKTTASGRVILSSGTHGVHTGDLPILACWVLGVGACAVLWTRQDP